MQGSRAGLNMASRFNKPALAPARPGALLGHQPRAAAQQPAPSIFFSSFPTPTHKNPFLPHHASASQTSTGPAGIARAEVLAVRPKPGSGQNSPEK